MQRCRERDKLVAAITKVLEEDLVSKSRRKFSSMYVDAVANRILRIFEGYAHQP